MSGNIISLAAVRKQRDRLKKRRQTTMNAEKHGRTKAESDRIDDIVAQAEKHLNAHKLTPKDDD